MGAVRPEEDSGLAVWALALEPPRPDTPTRRRGGDTWGARSRARAPTASPLSSSGRTHRSQTFQRTWGDAGGREREPERPVYCASYQATSKKLLTSSQENARRFALFPLSVSLSLSLLLFALSHSLSRRTCVWCVGKHSPGHATAQAICAENTQTDASVVSNERPTTAQTLH